MKPTKYKELLPEISNRAGRPLTEVEIVLMGFWKSVRTSLSTLEHPQLQVLNLGTFIANPKPINKRLQRRKSLLSKIQGTGLRSQAIRQDAQAEIELMEKVVQAQTQEAERRNCVREKRKNHVTN